VQAVVVVPAVLAVVEVEAEAEEVGALDFGPFPDLAQNPGQ
jgi:hypothetical protein